MQCRSLRVHSTPVRLIAHPMCSHICMEPPWLHNDLRSPHVMAGLRGRGHPTENTLSSEMREGWNKHASKLIFLTVSRAEILHARR